MAESLDWVGGGVLVFTRVWRWIADRLAAMDLAQQYGQKMHLGVFYRNPEPPPTYDALIRERQAMLTKDAPPVERILDLFIKK